MIRFGECLDLSRDFVEALVEMTQVATQLGDHLDHARREKLRMPTQNVRQGRAQETNALPDGNATLQEQGTNLVDDGSSMPDQAGAHPMHGLEIELLFPAPSSPMRWKLFLPMSMPIVVTWSVALRVMVHAPSVYCTQNLRMRLGARSVHPISGS